MAAATAASDISPALLVEQLKQHSREVQDFAGDSVAVLHAPVDPCAFLRQHVATNTPALIRGATDHWPAAQLWSPQYLDAAAGGTTISVQLTPNGLGDAVTPFTAAGGQQAECFCIPHSCRMTLRDFMALFFSGSARGANIPYLQQQNSNLTEELPELLADVDELAFASAAFGQPDATNLWIGDERAATTFHKDHYENLYAVLRGTKVFHLLPPTEVYRMGLQLYPLAKYEPQDDGRFVPVLQQPASSVLWSPINPNAGHDAHRAEHPLFFDASLPRPLRVEVQAGEVLYLPAMWWHYVEQRACPDQKWCLAVNYWYDMRFDSRYATYKLVESLARAAGLLPAQLPGDEEEDEDAGSGGGGEE